jgi:excisionase family DNA binding protein
MIDKIAYSRKEAAESLSISVSTIDRLITYGYFKPVRIGNKVRIPLKQLQKFAAGDHPKLEPQAA